LALVAALLLGAMLQTMSSANAAGSTWSSIAPMSGPRNHLAAAPAPDGLYVLGGDATADSCGAFCDVTHRVERYSAATDSWTTLAPMHLARDWLAAATGLDGRVYAIGGFSPECDCVTNTAEVYSPATGSWHFIAPLPVPRLMAAATTGPDGRIYLLGGGPALNVGRRSAFVYTPSTNTWSSAATMHDPRAAFAAATGGDGKIYAVGGTAEAYSPTSDSWTIVAPPPTTRGYLAGASGRDGRIFAVGGCCTPSGDAFDEVDAYSPSTKTWSAAPSMLTGRSTLGAAIGGDGNLYAAGGDAGLTSKVFDSAEVLSLGQRHDLQLDVFEGPDGARTLAYRNAGDLSSGGYAVLPATGSPTSLEGTGTIPSTIGGNATVSFHVNFDGVAARWTGTAVIDDSAAGFSATIPVHSGRHGITRSGTIVRGKLWGIKSLSVPQKCFMIVFAIDNSG
jgi:hypothetical protein